MYRLKLIRYQNIVLYSIMAIILLITFLDVEWYDMRGKNRWKYKNII